MPEETVVKENNSNVEQNPQELQKRIDHLRHLLEKEENLKTRKDDNFILRYLRCSQYDPESAIQKIKAYYALKNQNPQWFSTTASTEQFKLGLSKQCHYMLQDRDRFGKRIYVTKLGCIDPSKTTMSKQSQMHDLFLESILDEEETQLNGLSIIIDLKNYSWSLLRWLTPGNIRTAVKKLELLPFKKIQFHVVNSSLLLNASLKLILPFLSDKTKENIHFHHEDWPSLHKIISPEVLPKEFGGIKHNLNVEKLLQVMFENSERLEENLNMGYVQ